MTALAIGSSTPAVNATPASGISTPRLTTAVTTSRPAKPVSRTRGEVAHALRIAAATYGISEAKLRRVAMCESTLNPKATNGRYVGLFQFGIPLWRATPYARFSRTDPHAAALAAAWAFKRGMARHWPVCGRR